MPSTAAPDRSNWRVARVQISTSRVVTAPPPRITITPKLVRQKRNTTTPAAATAGATRGSATRRIAWAGVAPSTRAAASISGSSERERGADGAQHHRQVEAQVRCEDRPPGAAQVDGTLSSEERGERGSDDDARAARRGRSRSCASARDPGEAVAGEHRCDRDADRSVMTAEAAACATVTATTRQVRGEPSTRVRASSPQPSSGRTARRATASTGTAIARATTATAATPGGEPAAPTHSMSSRHCSIHSSRAVSICSGVSPRVVVGALRPLCELLRELDVDDGEHEVRRRQRRLPRRRSA